MDFKTTAIAERREFPRIRFTARSLLICPDSAEGVVGHTTELSRFGCFVQTVKPLPRRSRIHIEIANGEDIFTASGVVRYVTGDGLGIAFGLVDSTNYKVLAKWLSRISRRSARYSLRAVAEVKDLGSQTEQVAITGDLSAHGCFIQTLAPFPPGTRISLRIEHNGTEFTALGRVTDNVSEIGMGVEFVEIEPNDRAILHKLLPKSGDLR